ncbi:MAG: hypothetical protein H6733_05180 [Alphaproteobacteria bacterium]|nr:hypothetical protein [Alphaproteobacteria bacterium]
MRLVPLVLLLAACTAAPTDAVDDSDTDADTPTAYDGPPALDVLLVDNFLNKLVRHDELRDHGWTVTIPPFARDLSIVGDEVLVSDGAGATRHSLVDGAQTWQVTGYAGVQSARPLDGGGVLLAAQDGTDALLITVDADGVETGRVTVTDNPDLRLVRVLDDGHVLLTATEPQRVRELDASGAEVWSVPLAGKGYVATRDAEGHTWATTGGDARLVVLDTDGTELQAWGGLVDHPDLGLDWFSGFDHVNDDVVVVANWLGHGTWGTGPHVVAFDATNAVAWSWADHDALKQVTNVLVLDAGGF